MATSLASRKDEAVRRDAAIADREAELEATRTEPAATAERVRIKAAAVSAPEATAGERERRVELLSGELSLRAKRTGQSERVQAERQRAVEAGLAEREPAGVRP